MVVRGPRNCNSLSAWVRIKALFSLVWLVKSESISSLGLQVTGILEKVPRVSKYLRRPAVALINWLESLRVGVSTMLS